MEEEREEIFLDEKTSSAWKYFDVKDSDKFIATCKVCESDMAYDSVSDLVRHVSEHEDVVLSDDEEWQVESLGNKQIKRGRANLSRAWKYFTKVDNSRARCRICKKLLSYSSSVSNLTKHVAKLHSDTFEVEAEDFEDMTQDSDENESEIELKHRGPPRKEKRRSQVWRYFQRCDQNGFAQCLICQKRFKYGSSVSNLMKHIRCKHPEILTNNRIVDIKKEFVISTNGEMYEIEDEDADKDPIEMDAVNFEDSDEICPPKAKRQRTSTVKLSKSAPINVNVKTNNKHPDTLDVFGQYLVCLLREMPKSLSDKLQGEILKNVIAAKMNSAAIPVLNITVDVEENNSTNVASTSTE